MKNILLASTALVAFAGAAAADVKITGSAEIGIVGGSSDVPGVDIDTRFHTDVDVTFAMTGEADNGLSFGANVDLDEGGSGAAAVANDDDDGGANFFLAYGGFRLDMGDTDGAFDAAMQEVNIAGSINDAETGHAGFNGNSGLDGRGDGQIARFSYSMNGFTGHLSIEQGDTATPNAVIENSDNIWGVGVTYATDFSGTALTLGLGYQTQDKDDVWGVSVAAKMANGVMVRVNYSDMEIAGVDTTHWGLGVGYSMNALTVGVNYGKYETAGVDSSGWGLAANYDLGGGLVAQFGYGQSNPAGANNDSNSWSLGLAMSF